MRWAGTVIGVLAVVVGVIWMLQGLNILHGSVMSGNSVFVVVGPIVAVVGLAILFVFGVRRRSA